MAVMDRNEHHLTATLVVCMPADLVLHIKLEARSNMHHFGNLWQPSQPRVSRQHVEHYQQPTLLLMVGACEECAWPWLPALYRAIAGQGRP
eukprot:scaffold10181_cov19-Prasinocladus_malaysianus.AAC.1